MRQMSRARQPWGGEGRGGEGAGGGGGGRQPVAVVDKSGATVGGSDWRQRLAVVDGARTTVGGSGWQRAAGSPMASPPTTRTPLRTVAVRNPR